MNDFIIRGYQPGDEYAILEMFNEIFNEDRDISHWYWKYRDHPWGRYFLSLAQSPDGKLAAHYGGYPVRLIHWQKENGLKEFKTYHLGDKMSRPAFRNVGLRKKSLLARAFFHFKDEHGDVSPFGYGFGTHHSLRIGLLLFEYMDVERVPFRKLGFSQVRSKLRSRIIPFISRICVEEVNETDNQWTQFFYRVVPCYSCLTIRDADYLRWRYLTRPDKQYLMLALKSGPDLYGWSVFSRNQESIEWVDALFDPRYKDYVGRVLEYVKRHSFSSGAKEIHCWFSPRPRWWDQILNDTGFVREQEPRDLHLTGPVFNNPESEQFLRKNFYYTMGDADLF